MVHLFVGIPNRGEIRVELLHCLLRWIKDPRIELFIFAPSQSQPISSLHNLIAKKFMESNFEWLLLVNSDVAPPPNITEILFSDLDVVGVPVPIHRDGDVLVMALKEEDGGFAVVKDLSGGFVEVDVVSLDCLFVRRRVFEKLEKPYFRSVCDEEGLLEVGEDFDFCRRVREAGFKIHACGGLLCGSFCVVDLGRSPAALDRKVFEEVN